MKCNNSNCGKVFEKPIELFDGRKFCPFCKGDLLPNKNTKLQITLNNHQLLVQSERIFHEDWLLNANENMRIKRNEALETAIALCSEACGQGNPYAIINMGFYYENGYISTHRNQAEGLRAAYMNYSAVCFNSRPDVVMPSGANLDADKLCALMVGAAKSLYGVLAKIGEDTRGEILSAEKLNQDMDAVKGVLSHYGVNLSAEDMASVGKMQVMYSDYVYEVMSMMQNKARKPLFGLFKLTKDQLLEIDKQEAVSGVVRIKPLGEYINDGKIIIKLVSSASDGAIVGSIIDIHNSNDIAAVAGQSKQNNFYVFFYNDSCSFKRLKKSMKKRLYNEFVRNGNEGIIKLILNKVCGYVFTEDDIFMFYKTIGKLDDTIDKLIQYAKWEV